MPTAYKPKSIAVTVGTSPVQIQSTVAGSLKLGVIIQADTTNTNVLYVGDSSVTTANGISLAAGQSISLNDFGTPGLIHEWDLTNIYIVSGAAAQKARVSYAEPTGV